GIGADGGNQPARPLDADALEHVLAAGVGLDAERAFLDRHLHAIGAALDDHVRDPLPPELVRDDAPDPAVAADDEMIFDGFQHTFVAAALQPLREPAFDDDGG